MEGAEVRLVVSDPSMGAEDLEELALNLRDDLATLDVDRLEPARDGEAPRGTRGLDIAAVGALVVTTKASVDLAAQVVHVVRGWLSRAPAGRSVEVMVGEHRLTLQAATPEQQQELIDGFLRSVTTPAIDDTPRGQRS